MSAERAAGPPVVGGTKTTKELPLLWVVPSVSSLELRLCHQEIEPAGIWGGKRNAYFQDAYLPSWIFSIIVTANYCLKRTLNLGSVSNWTTLCVLRLRYCVTLKCPLLPSPSDVWLWLNYGKTNWCTVPSTWGWIFAVLCCWPGPSPRLCWCVFGKQPYSHWPVSQCQPVSREMGPELAITWRVSPDGVLSQCAPFGAVVAGCTFRRSWHWWKPVWEVSVPVLQFAVTLFCGAG